MDINVHLKCGRGCERGCGCGCGCNSNEKSWLISNAWNYEKCLGHQNANATLAINHLWPFVFQPSATLQLSAIRATPPPQPPFPKSHWIIVALANGKILFLRLIIFVYYSYFIYVRIYNHLYAFQLRDKWKKACHNQKENDFKNFLYQLSFLWCVLICEKV